MTISDFCECPSKLIRKASCLLNYTFVRKNNVRSCDVDKAMSPSSERQLVPHRLTLSPSTLLPHISHFISSTYMEFSWSFVPVSCIYFTVLVSYTVFFVPLRSNVSLS